MRPKFTWIRSTPAFCHCIPHLSVLIPHICTNVWSLFRTEKFELLTCCTTFTDII